MRPGRRDVRAAVDAIGQLGVDVQVLLRVGDRRLLEIVLREKRREQAEVRLIDLAEVQHALRRAGAVDARDVLVARGPRGESDLGFVQDPLLHEDHVVAGDRLAVGPLRAVDQVDLDIHLVAVDRDATVGDRRNVGRQLPVVLEVHGVVPQTPESRAEGLAVVGERVVGVEPDRARVTRDADHEVATLVADGFGLVLGRGEIDPTTGRRRRRCLGTARRGALARGRSAGGGRAGCLPARSCEDRPDGEQREQAFPHVVSPPVDSGRLPAAPHRLLLAVGPSLQPDQKVRSGGFDRRVWQAPCHGGRYYGDAVIPLSNGLDDHWVCRRHLLDRCRLALAASRI